MGISYVYCNASNEMALDADYVYIYIDLFTCLNFGSQVLIQCGAVA